jgi:hypothetical protein
MKFTLSNRYYLAFFACIDMYFVYHPIDSIFFVM